MKHTDATEIGNIVVERAHQVPTEAERYARGKVAPLGRYAPEPITFARVRLTRTGSRSIGAHANLDVNGTPVNAQVEAPTFAEGWTRSMTNCAPNC